MAGDPPGSDTPANRAPGRTAGHRRGPRLTGRGAIAGMLLVFFIGVLAADWLHWSPLADASFLIGSAAAAWYTKQRDLLTVAVSPPLLFFIVVICVKALTAAGNELLSTVEGAALTLANVAPWLFIGVVLSLIIAWFRGLPRCIAELRRDLRPELAQRRPRRCRGGGQHSHRGRVPARRQALPLTRQGQRSVRRSSGGSANTSRSSTASTSSTLP